MFDRSVNRGREVQQPEAPVTDGLGMWFHSHRSQIKLCSGKKANSIVLTPDLVLRHLFPQPWNIKDLYPSPCTFQPQIPQGLYGD